MRVTPEFGAQLFRHRGKIVVRDMDRAFTEKNPPSTKASGVLQTKCEGRVYLDLSIL